MKTIHRAILQELLGSMLVSFAALDMVLMTENIFRQSKEFGSVGASLADMIGLIALVQPQIAVMTIPMAFFIAVLLTIGRLNTDSEITALRACGMPFRSIARPVLYLGFACFVVALLLSVFVAPASISAMKSSIARTIAKRAPGAIEEGIFNTTLRGLMVYVSGKDKDGTLRGIFIEDERRRERPVTLWAESGSIHAMEGGGIGIALDRGKINILGTDSLTTLAFNHYELTLADLNQTPDKRYYELPTYSLVVEAQVNEKNRTKILMEFWKRFSLPASCVFLMLLGPPLGLRAGRTGRMGGLAIGLGVITLYYSITIYAEQLTRSGGIPVWLGAWGPTAVFLLASIIIFRKADMQ